MNNIDINLKNSKFYIVEVRVDDYRDGEHYFNTSDNILLFKYQAEKAKNEMFEREVGNYFTEREIVMPDNLFDYDNYETNMDYVNDSAFRENISWIDTDNVYVSARVKELTVNTNL